MERRQHRLALDELGVHKRHRHARTCIQPLQHIPASMGNGAVRILCYSASGIDSNWTQLKAPRKHQG